MQRKYEWAIGGVLTAGALAGGIFAGFFTGSTAKKNTASTGASSTPAAAQTNGGRALTTPSSGSVGSPSPSATGLPRCHTVDLSPTVSVVPGVAGLGAMNLTLKNTSGHACTIFGYPGLILQDQNGLGQPTIVTNDHGGTAKTLAVPDGGSASDTISYAYDPPGTGNPTTDNCEPPSYRLLITPPDETKQLTALIIGGPVAVCNRGELYPLAFVAGTKGTD